MNRIGDAADAAHGDVMLRLFICTVVLLFTGLAHAQEKPQPIAAKNQFGFAAGGSPTRPAAIGYYVNGCLAGGEALPVSGKSWQALRVWRNRNWGHPDMIRFIKNFSADTQKVGWPGLLIGDISQPRGGPMLSGHRSHQVGLDADIRYEPMPRRPLSAHERATMSGYMLAGAKETRVNENWSPGHAKILKIAAKNPRVQRILTHPAVKKKLCDTVKGDRTWLRKIRPVRGHNYHFHVRLLCPKGQRGCRAQKGVPRNDGCGAPLTYMLKLVSRKYKAPKITKPRPKPKPRPVFTIDRMPSACKTVLKVDRPQLLAPTVAPDRIAFSPRRNPRRR